MNIHLINLDRNANRLAQFQSANFHLRDLVRFPAVDGATISRREFRAQGVFASELPAYNNGAIGCALSHLSMWKKAVEQATVLTIVEDNALTNVNFESEGSLLLHALPSDWDILLWGWNFDSILLFEFLPGVSPCLGAFSEPNLRTIPLPSSVFASSRRRTGCKGPSERWRIRSRRRARQSWRSIACRYGRWTSFARG